MPSFNLSSWALRNQALVLYSIILLGLIGIWSFRGLGQAEDPPFTFKVMVVRTVWPGATAERGRRQVTERIEKKLQEIPDLDFLRSYSRPGESQVFFVVKDSIAPGRRCRMSGTRCARRLAISAHACRPACAGRSSTTSSAIPSATSTRSVGDGFNYDDLRKYAERMQARTAARAGRGQGRTDRPAGREDLRRACRTPSSPRSASTGAELKQTLAAQNAIAPGGSFETATDRIYLRTSGALDSVEAIRNLSIRGNTGRLFRLGDIAEVRRGFVDPPQPRMRFTASIRSACRVDAQRRRHHCPGSRPRGRHPAHCHDLAGRLEICTRCPTSRCRCAFGQRVRAHPGRSGADRAAGQLLLARPAHRLVVALSIPLVLAMTFALMNHLRHRPAQDLARRAGAGRSACSWTTPSSRWK
jgi:multidrug efflux pump